MGAKTMPYPHDLRATRKPARELLSKASVMSNSTRVGLFKGQSTHHSIGQSASVIPRVDC